MSPHDLPTIAPTGDEPVCNSCAVYEAMARRAQSELFNERQRAGELADELLRVTFELKAAHQTIADRRADCDALRRVVERLSGEHDPLPDPEAVDERHTAEHNAPTWAPPEDSP